MRKGEDYEFTSSNLIIWVTAGLCGHVGADLLFFDDLQLVPDYRI